MFRELVMQPIGASPDWEWHGYRNSYVEIDGQRVQSVSGGGHWGGGVFISARDQARIGLMLLRRGMWGARRILSEAWIERMLEPARFIAIRLSVVAEHWARPLPERLGQRSYYARGAGGNLTWIDPENDLVAVLRWTDPAAMDGFMKLATAGDPRLTAACAAAGLSVRQASSSSGTGCGRAGRNRFGRAPASPGAGRSPAPGTTGW